MNNIFNIKINHSLKKFLMPDKEKIFFEGGVKVSMFIFFTEILKKTDNIKILNKLHNSKSIIVRDKIIKNKNTQTFLLKK